MMELHIVRAVNVHFGERPVDLRRLHDVMRKLSPEIDASDGQFDDHPACTIEARTKVSSGDSNTSYSLHPFVVTSKRNSVVFHLDTSSAASQTPLDYVELSRHIVFCADRIRTAVLMSVSMQRFAVVFSPSHLCDASSHQSDESECDVDLCVWVLGVGLGLALCAVELEDREFEQLAFTVQYPQAAAMCRTHISAMLNALSLCSANGVSVMPLNEVACVHARVMLF